jgi:hypothetical protein
MVCFDKFQSIPPPSIDLEQFETLKKSSFLHFLQCGERKSRTGSAVAVLLVMKLFDPVAIVDKSCLNRQIKRADDRNTCSYHSHVNSVRHFSYAEQKV